MTIVENGITACSLNSCTVNQRNCRSIRVCIRTVINRQIQRFAVLISILCCFGSIDFRQSRTALVQVINRITGSLDCRPASNMFNQAVIVNAVATGGFNLHLIGSIHTDLGNRSCIVRVNVFSFDFGILVSNIAVIAIILLILCRASRSQHNCLSRCCECDLSANRVEHSANAKCIFRTGRNMYTVFAITIDAD